MVSKKLFSQNTLKNPNDIVIYCDNREKKSKVYPILKNRCNVIELNLEVGDYLLSSNVGVERKTTNDFISSIMDGRLFTQSKNMKDTFSNPLMIIEGEDITETKINIHPNAIRGALASVAIEFGIPIIWTKTQLETAEMLFSIAKREQFGLKKDISIRSGKKAKTHKEVQEFLLSGLPNINTKTSKKLLKKFNTPRNVFNASEEELQEVDGIGKKLSKKIVKTVIKKYSDKK